MNQHVRFKSTAVLLPLVVAFCWLGPASAQVPDKFTNLKILPKSIKKDDLVSTMRGFSIGLGVRCNYCHADMDTTKGKGLDFASDAKKQKTIARNMMTMVSTINTKLIPKAGIGSPVQVGCVTCHHGVEKPQTLTDALKATAQKDGVPAAEQQYRDLRAKYYGSGAYDFSARSLRDLARWLSEDRKDLDGAIQILKLSIEKDPADPENYIALGMTQSKKGDNAAAIESLKHAIELDPENSRAQDMLNQLQSGK